MMGKDEDCSSDEETPSPTCSKTKSSFTQHNDARTKKRARSSPPVAPTQFSKCYRKRRQVTDIHVAQFGADREILESMMNAAKSNDDQERATGGKTASTPLRTNHGSDYG